MANPEGEFLLIGKAANSVELRIKNPKLFSFSALLKIAEYQIPQENREIIAIKNDEEIALLDVKFRENLKRTMLFGVSKQNVLSHIALQMLAADKIILRETSNSSDSAIRCVDK